MDTAAQLETLQRLDPDARSKVVVDPSTQCWEWTTGINVSGYGTVYRERTTKLSHRFVYELLVGEIPEGLVIDHLCSNRACCNPAHLEPVTRSENTRRGSTGRTRKSSEMAKRQTKQYAARLPEDLYEQVKGVADEQGVSFNSFLNSALRSAVGQPAGNAVYSSASLASYTSSAPTTTNYVIVTSEDSLSDVIAQLSTGESHGEEAEEGTEAG